MPFTPFHLGPALAGGLPLRRYMHAPTFIVGNVVLDLEPLAVMVFGFDYPLHGYLHTFLLAFAVGGILGLVMFKVEKPLQPLYRTLQLEAGAPLKFRSFLLAGILGAALHVLLDAFLYLEMQPFFPFASNPLLDFSLSMTSVYLLCVYLGVFGAVYYVVLVAYGWYRKTLKNSL